MEKPGFIYILTNKGNRVLYTGVTSNLAKRISEHKAPSVDCFTKRYNCTKLVYVEDCGSIEQAIAREKQLKAGPRRKKVALIDSQNPLWEDISNRFFG